MKKCENCDKSHNDNYGSGRFCSSKCARGFSTKAKRKEINEKVSKTLMGGTHHYRGKPGKFTLEKNCIFCDSLFITKTKNTIKQKFCSFNCWQNNIRLYKTAFEIYKIKCKFMFNVYNYPNYFDIEILNKYGWYSAFNKGNNKNGISRDHIYSIKDGFVNGVACEIISHPANCRLISHTENQKKSFYSSISLEELKIKILKFDLEHGVGFEPTLF